MATTTNAKRRTVANYRNSKPAKSNTTIREQSVSEAWDKQIAHDVAAGKWDDHMEQAMREHRAGHTREL